MERGTGERMEEGAVGPKSQRADIFALTGSIARRNVHTPQSVRRNADTRTRLYFCGVRLMVVVSFG
jgi:hypothetical protein